MVLMFSDLLPSPFPGKTRFVPPSAPDRSGRSSAILRHAAASHLPGYAEPLMGFGLFANV